MFPEIRKAALFACGGDERTRKLDVVAMIRGGAAEEIIVGEHVLERAKAADRVQSGAFYGNRCAERIAQRLECGRHYHHRGEIGIDGKRLEARGERAARARPLEKRGDSRLIFPGEVASFAAGVVARP